MSVDPRWEFEQWLAFGKVRGWIGDPFCWVHGSPQLTDEEMELTEQEDDLDAICVTVARLTP